jgi:3-deoxy-7-phosphoheptulonate synthase
MIIQFEPTATVAKKNAVLEQLESIRYKSSHVKTQRAEYLVAVGKQAFDIRTIGHLPGIRDVHRVSDDYKLVSNKWKTERTCIDLGDDVKIGDGEFALMAGPCSIENEDNVAAVIAHLQKCGVRIMRGGVFKPRSSPYSFRGIGLEGLKMWHEQASAAGIKIISEVMQVSQVEQMYPYVDIFQVGARNTQNFNLLDELGKVDKPVMIKRGISGTIEELLQSAEYVFSGGNEKILLCERGIRTFETASRNTFDINAIPILKGKSHLPVIADPSHAIGLREHVEAISLAAVAAGADGLIIEIHPTPELALSDAQQTIDFEEMERLVAKVWKLREVI